MDNRKIKFRFYHVPKTGGTSIFGMTSGWKNHKRADPRINHVRIRDIVPKDDEIAYTVVRNPYNRFVSAFYHLVDACDPNFFYKDAPVSDCNYLRDNNLSMTIFDNDPNKFLKALVDKTSKNHIVARKMFYHFDIFKSQMYWLGDSSGKLHSSIGIILRQETLRDDFEEYIAGPLGQTPNWPNDNKRITQETIPLTDKSKRIIERLYPRDFSL